MEYKTGTRLCARLFGSVLKLLPEFATVTLRLAASDHICQVKPCLRHGDPRISLYFFHVLISWPWSFGLNRCEPYRLSPTFASVWSPLEGFLLALFSNLSFLSSKKENFFLAPCTVSFATNFFISGGTVSPCSYTRNSAISVGTFPRGTMLWLRKSKVRETNLPKTVGVVKFQAR